MEQKTVLLEIKGMTCDHCAKTIDDALRMKGILDKSVSFKENRARVTFEETALSLGTIVQKIEKIGPYRISGIQDFSVDDAGSKKHLVIIGGGSAAFAAAIQAQELGARVTMINDSSSGKGLPIGGTCVNVGCVPSKNLIRAAEALHQAKESRFSGIETSAGLSDFKKVIAQKRELVQTLRREKYLNVIEDMDQITVIDGRARLVSANRVEVNGETVNADAILIATGASPNIPEIPGLKESGYLTNETAFELNELPEHVVVLGGNYIGLETAQMFARFGSKVSLVELMPQILPTETPDVAEEIQQHLEREGIKFYTKARTMRVFKDNRSTVLEVSVNGRVETIRCSHVIVATGRKANTSNMGLEEVGVALNGRGFLEVDAHLQTNVPGIYGAGDVIGNFMFVYTAAYEGKIAAYNALSGAKKETDYTALPWVVFTDPQVAGVGLNEAQAAEQGLEVETARLDLSYVPRSLAARDTRGFIKLIREKKNDRLIGARIVAPEGSELLMELAMAIKFGITVEQLKEMFHPYLTLSEGIKLAAITFSKNVNTLSCCAT